MSPTAGLVPAGLALASALVFGAGDFWGGIASRRVSPRRVIVISELSGVPLAVVAALLLRANAADVGRIAIGTLGGVVGALGLVALFVAMRRGRIGLVSPITAVGAAAIPVIWGVLFGDRPQPLQLAGIGIGMVAMAALGYEPGDEGATEPQPFLGAGVALAVLAGVLFGAYFICFHAAGSAGVWCAATARICSAAILASWLLLSREGLALPRGALRPAVASGLADCAGGILYLLASGAGLLSIVSVLASLYPAVTVILAMIFLGERLRRVQSVGAAAAVLAVVLIGAG